MSQPESRGGKNDVNSKKVTFGDDTIFSESLTTNSKCSPNMEDNTLRNEQCSLNRINPDYISE